MRRLLLCLAVAAGALVLAPAALADGPLFVTQGGAGVASRNGAFHYVAVPDGTRGALLEKIEVAHGQVYSWLRLDGSWGNPALGAGGTIGEGLSYDGRTLVLASTAGPYGSPSRFVVVDTRLMRVVRTITLHGSFSFDALSPDASRLYLIQYAYGRQGDLSDYIVRGYDLRANRLLPGRIADRTQKDWSMHGSPVTRTYSAGGRWVYTLYENPGNYPFVHALDTVRGKAHCIKLPWEEDWTRTGSGTSSSGFATAAGRSRCTGGAGARGCGSPSAAGGSHIRAPASHGSGPRRGSAASSCSPPPAAAYSCGAAATRTSTSTRDRSSGSRSVT